MSSDDGAGLARSMAVVSHDSKAMALAMLDETGLWRLLYARLNDLATKVKNQVSTAINEHETVATTDNFQEILKKHSCELLEHADDELLLRMYGQLNQLLSVKPRHYVSHQDFADNASDITLRAIELLKMREKDFTGNDLSALVNFEIQRLLSTGKESGKQFESYSVDEQNAYITRVRNFIGSLPPEHQQHLLKRLGVTELSDAVLKQALTGGALWGVFAGAVEIFGFSFYAGATSLLASLSPFTLPFATYTTLTSLIAVLAHPLFLVAFLGLGWWMYAHKNRILRERLAISMVATIFTVGLGEDAAQMSLRSEKTMALALQRWEGARRDRDTRRKGVKLAQSVASTAKAALERTKEEIHELRQQDDKLEALEENIFRALSTYCKIKPHLFVSEGWGSRISTEARKLIRAKESLTRLRQPGRHSREGWWKQTKTFITEKWDSWNLMGELKTNTEALAECVREAWKSKNHHGFTGAKHLIRLMDELDSNEASLEQCRQARVQQEAIEVKQKETLAQRNGEAYKAEELLRQAEEKYFGLGELP